MSDVSKVSGNAIRRWMYGEDLDRFDVQDETVILGELLKNSAGDVELTQRLAWREQIRLLQSIQLHKQVPKGARIYFELAVPRLGRRADVVLLVANVLVVVEFKVGEASFNQSALDQVWDYALDFKFFHDASRDICVLPVLVATKARPPVVNIGIEGSADRIAKPVCAAPSQLAAIIDAGLAYFNGEPIDVDVWERGRYLPTPTIVEAARALYAGHTVEDISRCDAGARNLAVTRELIDRIIEKSRGARRKSICFVTGVPGAGKTLVGLDVANRHLDRKSETYSVFLSGNGPLVAVLREALARDSVARAAQDGKVVRKGNARKEVESFIQNVHQFRDEYLRDPDAPPEHVVLFDEAQRAWDIEQTCAFMQRKKGKADFNQSEPEFLISCLDRHEDWAVVVCLVGSGQEINTGEAGISEWFDAILKRFHSWDVYLSPSLPRLSFRAELPLRKFLLGKTPARTPICTSQHQCDRFEQIR